MKFLVASILAATVTLTDAAVNAVCGNGEIVSRFSLVTKTDKQPKGIASSLLGDRVNAEMGGLHGELVELDSPSRRHGP